ncbi:hypothetical protein UFOVP395_131 [uncultured Caudovirales phage]|jgi:hypothetical protein|uniref:Uncharacterized protein n=1 Tax=uncultured Caudovirales phage TaxID=2100421 RepID=A0A6J5M6L6_9CAUD|nr:hypothetical protein UFOVP395_131 [uncultured Caudovirales phage]
MVTSNNVITFPLKNSRAPITMEQVEENLDLVRQIHIQETLELVVPKMFESFAVAGFAADDESNEYLKHGAMIVEAARSFLCKMSDMHHPLQLIAENMFEQIDDEGNLEVSDKIKIIITPNEGKS